LDSGKDRQSSARPQCPSVRGTSARLTDAGVGWQIASEY
jgi:hypothetical protein